MSETSFVKKWYLFSGLMGAFGMDVGFGSTRL